MRLIDHISRWTSWPLAITIFIVAIGSYLLYFSYSEPLKDLVGDQQILDMRGSGYDLEDARALLEVLGEEGRAFYMRTTILDTVWPLLVALSAIFFAPLAFRATWTVIVVILFPLAFGVLDAFENFGILVMLANYPELSSGLVSYCEAITRVKWMVIPIAFPVFLALPIAAFGRWLFEKWRSD